MKAYPSTGKVIWLASCVRMLLALNMPYRDGSTIGQEYHTSLGQGVPRDAVTISGKDEVKRSEELDDKTWTPRFANESPQFEIKVSGKKELLTDPETKVETTYDCSQWYEYYGHDNWTWARLRFCFQTQTDVLKVTVFRDGAQYYWGGAWYNEKDAYPAYVQADVTLSGVDSKQLAYKSRPPHSTDKEFNLIRGYSRATQWGENDTLLPGNYSVDAFFSQEGPYWFELDTLLAKHAHFDIAVLTSLVEGEGSENAVFESSQSTEAA